MPRIASTLILACAVSLLAGSVAVAGSSKGCPAVSSGWMPGGVDWTWELGDGVPAPGEDLLWDVAAAGVAAEGLTLEDIAEGFGFASVEEFYAFALEGWRGLDKDGDGEICFKPQAPTQNAWPAYFFKFIDNQAQTAN